MMKNFYFYPPRVPIDRNIVLNPYTSSFIESLDKKVNVLNKDTFAKIAIVDLFKYIFSIDVIIFNWIENIGYKKLGKLQFVFFMFAFVILKLRKVKIVWVFHNIHPHKGESFISKYMYSLFFDASDLIVTHSKKADKYVKAHSSKKTFFTHHPNNKIQIDNSILNIDESCDVRKKDILIWGSIEPYKGIVEFLDFNKKMGQAKAFKIQIIGTCNDVNYENEILKYTNDNVVFENRRVSFLELNKHIDNSKFVLFPYRSNSVSSSGALLDTLTFNGSCIGPNTGCFSDLAEEGLCYVFRSYEEILNIVSTNNSIDNDKMQYFVQGNSWDKFIVKLISEIKKDRTKF
jgi:hypothetical protein